MTRLMCGLAAIAISAPAFAEDHLVIIDAMRFQPSVLNVAIGDTVLFENADTVPHTVSAMARGLDRGREGGAAFESGIIAPGQSRRIEMHRSGEIDFICDHHPLMRGRVVVD